MRVAKALKGMKKMVDSLKAFINAYKDISVTEEKVQIEILLELVLVCKHLSPGSCLTLSQMTNFFRLSKLKEFADDNFKFDENDRKFLKWVENTVGKGEIARYEQFLLFPQCFQKTYAADT